MHRMSGFIAVVSNDDAPLEEDVTGLAGAYERLRGTKNREEFSHGDRVRAVLLNPDWRSPMIEREAAGWAFAAGSPDRASGLVRAPLRELDGQFALMRCTADELTVATDPYGSFGVFHAERDGRTYVSTCALALAAHLKARPDRLGLTLFLCSGYQVGAQTNWEGIRRLEPGSRLDLTHGAARIESYWRPTVDGRLRKLDLTGASDHLIEAATSTRRRLADGSVWWADLSGGYDSRLNTLLLERAGVQFECYTRGEPGDDDVAIARELAQLGGWDLKWFSAGRDADTEAVPWQEATAWCDGHLNALNVKRGLSLDAARSRVHHGVLSGGGGEFLRSFASRQELFRAGRTNRVNYDNWIDMRLLHPIDTSVFAADPLPEVREDLRKRMTAWAQPYAAEPNTTQLDVLYMYKNTGHFGPILSATAGVIDLRLPFFSKPLLEGVMSIPFQHRRMERLMRQMIDRLNPRLASVRTTWGGPAQPRRVTNLHKFAPFYADVARRAAVKLAERTVSWQTRPPTVGEDERRLAERLEGLQEIGGGAELRGARLYNPNAVRSLLDRARQPAFKDDDFFGRIVTVELALQAADAALE
jgi:asparagine synthetase B (glutamine-hydrolysing)